MDNRKLQKKRRAVKTVETYAAPTCSSASCQYLCNMTVADVRVDVMVSLTNHASVQE